MNRRDGSANVDDPALPDSTLNKPTLIDLDRESGNSSGTRYDRLTWLMTSVAPTDVIRLSAKSPAVFVVLNKEAAVVANHNGGFCD